MKPIADWLKRNCLMQIWVDADACPVEIKDLLYRTAERVKIKLILVANQSMRVPRSEFIEALLVRDGANVADRRIVELAASGDLVVTADIPLAADVVAKGVAAIDPRGNLYTDANIGDRLALRNMLDQLRGGSYVGGGPSPFSPKDRQAFANQLDRWLAKKKE
jgi:uncharacterized protein YaiI (UPF0178 family)